MFRTSTCSPEEWTMLRNALGKDEGGSGVTLDRKAYTQSVEYWTSHATIKA